MIWDFCSGFQGVGSFEEGRLRNRKGPAKQQAGIGTFQRQLRIVQPRDSRHQAETESAARPGTRRVEPYETLQNPLPRLLRDARSIIANPELRAALRCPQAELDATAGARILHGVVQQVCQRLSQQLAV